MPGAPRLRAEVCWAARARSAAVAGADPRVQAGRQTGRGPAGAANDRAARGGARTSGQPRLICIRGEGARDVMRGGEGRGEMEDERGGNPVGCSMRGEGGFPAGRSMKEKRGGGSLWAVP